MREPSSLITLRGHVAARAQSATDETADQAAAAAAELAAGGGRTIAGTLLPYGEVARLADGQLYRFAPGSLELDRADPSFLLGHDQNRPIGVLAELENTPELARASFRIDETPDGDVALAQAQSGSRRGLSVGAEPITWSVDESGDEPVIDIARAGVRESSLVTIAAYPAAGVASVAAQAPPNGGPVNASSGTAGTSADSPPLTAASEQAVGAAPAVPLEARAHAAPVVVGERSPAARLNATGLVVQMVRAARGDQHAAQLVQAAMAATSYLADNPGVLPIETTREIEGGLDQARVLYDLCAHPPLPDSGMEFNSPVWVVKPDGGWMADDTADPASNTPKIGFRNTGLRQWAYAFRCSVALMERSSPDWVDAVYAESIKDYYADVEAVIAGMLPATTSAATVGEAIGEVFAGTKRAANVWLMSPDQFGVLFDMTGVSLWTQGSVSTSASGVVGNIGGLILAVSGDLPAGSNYIGTRNAIEVRESRPIRLSANVIGAMDVELGITSFASFRPLWNTANAPESRWAKVAALTPSGAPAALGSAERAGIGAGQQQQSGSESRRSERSR